MAFIGSTTTFKYDSYTDLPSTSMDGDLAFCIDTQLSYRYSATSSTWTPLTRELVKQSTVTLDGKTTGAVTIYTLEGSGTYKFYPTQIVIRAVNISGGVIKPTFTVGTNATAYDNIANSTLLGSVLSLTGITAQPMTVSTSPGLVGGSVIKANITIGATATAYTFKLDILGYYAT